MIFNRYVQSGCFKFSMFPQTINKHKMHAIKRYGTHAKFLSAKDRILNYNC